VAPISGMTVIIAVDSPAANPFDILMAPSPGLPQDMLR
jgi:hypothetical protein